MKRPQALAIGTIAVALVLATTGCATRQHRLYAGSPKLPTEVAVLKCGEGNLVNGMFMIWVIDGRQGPNMGGNYGYNCELEIEPGAHSVEVSYDRGTWFTGGAVSFRGEVHFDAQAGKRYHFQAEADPSAMRRALAIAVGVARGAHVAIVEAE